VAALEITGEVWYWRGPAPYHFVTAPEEACVVLRAAAPSATYGWGMIPVRCRLGETSWTTSLWPKDGGYVVPLKTAVRRAEAVAEGDAVTVLLEIEGDEGRVDRDELVEIVRRVQAGEARTEEQEEAWLAEFARQVPHPRAIDLVLYPEVEVGEDAGPGDVVDHALAWRPSR
jgi:hypothetical protein